jgi:hypothetical protein
VAVVAHRLVATWAAAPKVVPEEEDPSVAGGGPQMVMMGGPGPAGAAKYNLTLSLNVQNVLNHVNFGRPEGNLTSP